jgi:hypothetical protein
MVVKPVEDSQEVLFSQSRVDQILIGDIPIVMTLALGS